jgi:hypothetical protein
MGAYESSFDDTTTAVVTTINDNGNNTSPTPGSLRAAIKAGNSAGGPFRIVFNVSGGCPAILNLNPAAPMLDISGDVTIDGTTQPGWSATTDFGKFDAKLCLFLKGVGDATTPWALHVPSTASGARLVVRGLGFTGFGDAAIKLEGGSNHRIAGNQFGALFGAPNHNAIRVTGNSGGAFIGGYDDPAALNVIAGSTNTGISLENAGGGSTLANNVVGFLPDGTSGPASGNANGVGIYSSPNNTVQYNSIGNSATYGVFMVGSASSGNLLQYNLVGMNRVGGTSYAGNNTASGVYVAEAAQKNTIEPLSSTYGSAYGTNVISSNGGPGVWIESSGGNGNSVLGNSFSGTGLGIDLVQAGPTANHSASIQTSGPNNLQNYPVLATATRQVTSTSTTEAVTGTLVSVPNKQYRLDLYWGGCRADGRGGELVPLATATVTVGVFGGTVPFTATVPVDLKDAAASISGTLTDSSGNTSEIGNCVPEVIDDRIFRNGFD